MTAAKDDPRPSGRSDGTQNQRGAHACDRRRIDVGGELGHEIGIGFGIASTLPEVLARHGRPAGTRVLAVVDTNVLVHADSIEASLGAAGYDVARIAIEASEAGKTIDAVAAIWRAALAARIGRRDVLVAIGGGLVGDVAGFAAASYLRGIAYVQMPTTLLAMVDASTGGKTGVNLPLPSGGLGKNLAGAFWCPLAVLADPTFLRTLPERELRSGLAECVKHAILDSGDSGDSGHSGDGSSDGHLRFLEEVVHAVVNAALGRTLDPTARALLVDLVERSVRVKAGFVERDPREGSERAALNLGHTFGHALETWPALDLTHGEAVAIGLHAAAVVGGRMFPGADDLVLRVVRALDRCGLPTTIASAGPGGTSPAAVSADAILARMNFDKKVDGGRVRFVVPRAIGRVDHGVAVDEAHVRAALAAIGCT
jgi:3-dehydroquinate synthetase